MFEKRVYCKDEELCELSKRFDELGTKINEYENMLNSAYFHESNLQLDLPDKPILHLYSEFLKISKEYDELEYNLNSLWQKRCVWKRIPPFRYWFKK